ncbi:MAG: nitrite reductase [Candidatus Thermoplasmatota archaeon]|nr:nitrite reductase [Candidatus Thermoplasmatota archaeon]
MSEETEKYLGNFLKGLPSEELFFEALRDLMKDLIKEYLKKKINETPGLKNQLVNVLEKYLEGKTKEYDSMVRMAKFIAEIGLASAPKDIKDEAISEFFSTFRNELEEVIRRTL